MTTTDFHALIPARLESQRLPRKVLAEVAGRPLLEWVWRRAVASGASTVAIATDSETVAAVARAFGAAVVMTSKQHDSGTSRLAEAARTLALPDDAIVVNLQGDEPEMPPHCLSQVAELLHRRPEAQMATLYADLDDEHQWREPDVVKLVTDTTGRALYFSRAPIPWPRDGAFQGAWRHLGLYAFRVAALKIWPALPPSELEQCERLEQLRALQAGWTIVADRACRAVPPGIDTPEDLARLRRTLQDG